MDAFGMTRGAVLAVGGGVDLSAIALRCALLCFCSRVFGGAIIACLTELEEKKFIVIVLQGSLFCVYS